MTGDYFFWLFATPYRCDCAIVVMHWKHILHYHTMREYLDL